MELTADELYLAIHAVNIQTDYEAARVQMCATPERIKYHEDRAKAYDALGHKLYPLWVETKKKEMNQA